MEGVRRGDCGNRRAIVGLLRVAGRKREPPEVPQLFSFPLQLPWFGLPVPERWQALDGPQCKSDRLQPLPGSV